MSTTSRKSNSPDANVRFDAILSRNESYTQSYTPLPPLRTLLATIAPSFSGIYILTCADSRVMPSQIFSLERGEASILRNAGGRVTDDTFRSLGVMGSLAPIGLVVVLHHSDCGGLNTTDGEVARKLGERAPAHRHEVVGRWFGTFRDVGLDESVRVDVEGVKGWAFLPAQAKVLGCVFEVETGRVRVVVPVEGEGEGRL